MECSSTSQLIKEPVIQLFEQPQLRRWLTGIHRHHTYNNSDCSIHFSLTNLLLVGNLVTIHFHITRS